MTVHMNGAAERPPFPNLPQDAAPAGCWQRTVDGISWFVNITVNASGWIVDTISSLVFSILRIVWPWGADKLEALWGRITTIYERIASAIREDGFKAEIDKLKTEKTNLAGTIHNLTLRIEEFRATHENMNWEKHASSQELSRVVNQREELILGQAPMLIERDQLKKEKSLLMQQINELRAKTNLLTQERDNLQQEKQKLAEAHKNGLNELGTLRFQLAQSEDYQHLNQHLERFHECYNRISHEGNRDATHLALETLIPSYQTHREKLHQMLKDTINSLPPNDIHRIPLNGILRLSEAEMGHIEKISQTLHLIEELRTPLADYFNEDPITTNTVAVSVGI